MTLLDELNEKLVAAMKARDEPTVSALRMVRARITDRRNAKDFDGDLSDEVVQGIVGAYVKQLEKALPEYHRAGAAGAETVARYEREIAYLAAFLPKRLDEGATREIVERTVTELGVTDPKRAGQVMGAIMKAHKGNVEPALVKKLVDETLSK